MHRVRSNGNVSALVDSADGSLDAKYEYGAFGEPLRVSGTTIAADNPFRFSTKFLDKDGARKRVDGDAEGVARRAEEAGAPWALMRQTGLIYYGFRYYSASLGRFLNRDPIGEAGGTNLYAFVENDPVNGWDYMGYGMDYIGGPGCESQCLSYMAEFEYRSFRECMEDRCPGLLLDDFEVKENKVRNWGGQSTNLGLILSAGGGGGGGGGGDGGGASGNDGCDEEKEEEEWQVNKKDCARLFKDWGSRYFAKPGDRFTGNFAEFNAAIAGLFQLARRDDFGARESGFGVYGGTYTEGGFLGFLGDEKTYYSFTKITPGGGSWNPFARGYSSYNPEFLMHLRNNSLVGSGHSHPADPGEDRFSYYIEGKAYIGSGEVKMGGDGAFHYGRYNYLIGDELSMRIMSFEASPRFADSSRMADIYMQQFDPRGLMVPGAPSPDTVSKLLACEKAGFKP